MGILNYVETRETINSNGINEDYLKTNGIDAEINEFKKESLKQIRFRILSKHAVISVIALIVSLFIDVSNVPILGNISIIISQQLFPGWEPINQAISPISFWWMPFVVYLVFLLFAYKAYIELRNAVQESSSPEIIDRIVGSSVSVIDGISTALPLIGAAILLISIKLGPEVFLGLSVPFEIKALIVLAIGKLFEPVLDEMTVEFHHIINKANDLKSRYYAQAQLDHFEKIVKRLETNQINSPGAMQTTDLKIYESVLTRIVELSEQIHRNFKQTAELFGKIKDVSNFDTEKLTQLSLVAEKITQATESLKNENTVRSLQSLESLIKK